jgi:hypothetical protein
MKNQLDFNKLNEIQKTKLFFDRLDNLKGADLTKVPMEDMIEMVLLMGETNCDDELKKKYNQLHNRKRNLDNLDI